MFFHSILREEQNSMIYRFLQAQMQNPVKGDWIIDLRIFLEEVEIMDTANQIKKNSEQGSKEEDLQSFDWSEKFP